MYYNLNMNRIYHEELISTLLFEISLTRSYLGFILKKYDLSIILFLFCFF